MEPVEVRTSHGTLAGQVENGLRVFRGVPFARAPVGAQRFRPPAPAEPWQGTRDATAFAPAAMQPATGGPASLSRPVSSEDCLYLNVWAPGQPGPHPVFLWVHGGREFAGGTDDPTYSGAALAARGVVVVTTAYRLGVFGFLALEQLLGSAYAGSANNALRDQVAALRWVHDEIAAFGGNPERVTVGGESSGGLNVATLLAVDEARPLFTGVILESSFGGRPLLEPAQADAVTAALLDRLDIEPARADAILEMSAERLIEAQTAVFEDDPFPFRPVVDGIVVAQSGTDAVSRGGYGTKPILIGSNLNEYDLFALRDPLEADPGPERMVNVESAELARRLNADYRARFPDLPDDERRRRLMTAEEHWIPSIRVAEAQAERDQPVWMYRFDWKPADQRERGLRAAHTMELPFVFGTFDAFPDGGITGTAADRPELSRRMGDHWASFIATGDPGWGRFDHANRTTMLFDRDSRTVQDPDRAERLLWEGLLALPVRGEG